MAKLLTIKNRFKNHMVKPTNSAQENADLVPLEVTEHMICKKDDWRGLWNAYNQHLSPIMDSEGKPTGNYEDDLTVVLLMHVMDITPEMYESLYDCNFIELLEE
ncbi:MAG TPA: hypothetical protein PLE74_01040 [Candidatus Cloacimonadota bacterium]|nr:hypothetical protein [Candidatus Cloacimonadota bacterium]